MNTLFQTSLLALVQYIEQTPEAYNLTHLPPKVIAEVLNQSRLYGHLTDTVLVQILSSASFMTLQIPSSLRLTDGGLRAMIRSPDIKTLNGIYYYLTYIVSGCVQLTDYGLSVILTHLKQLEVLNIASCYQITDQGFVLEDEKRLDTLVEVNVSGCGKIEDKFCYAISGCPIRSLDVSGCKKLTDFALAFSIAFFRDVVYLNLSGCVNVAQCTIDVWCVLY